MTLRKRGAMRLALFCATVAMLAAFAPSTAPEAPVVPGETLVD